MAEHSIRITRSESKVYVAISTDLPADVDMAEVWFSHECKSPIEAVLLRDYLLERQSQSIKAIREAEFWSGWRHGKAKKRAKGFFKYFWYSMKQAATHGNIK